MEIENKREKIMIVEAHSADIDTEMISEKAIASYKSHKEDLLRELSAISCDQKKIAFAYVAGYADRYTKDRNIDRIVEAARAKAEEEI